MLGILFFLVFGLGLFLPTMNYYEIRHSYLFEDNINRECIMFIEITRVSQNAGFLRFHRFESPRQLIKIRISKDCTVNKCILASKYEITFSNNITNLFNFKGNFYFMQREKHSKRCQVFFLDECDIKLMEDVSATQILQSARLNCATGTPEETDRCDKLSLNYGYMRKESISITSDYITDPIKLFGGISVMTVRKSEDSNAMILLYNDILLNKNKQLLILKISKFHTYNFAEWFK